MECPVWDIGLPMQLVQQEKLKAMLTYVTVDICNEARRKLPLLSMPSDLIKQLRYDRKYKRLIYERGNAVEYENTLNNSVIKCYPDGSKINGEVGSGFYVEYPILLSNN